MIWLKLKLEDKNRFLIRAFKEKITLYEIKEEKDVCLAVEFWRGV